MNAIIIAAGDGKRISDDVKSTPKALIDVNGQPIINYQIQALREVGINNIVIITGKSHEKFEEIYGIVLEAQLAAEKAAEPGMRAADLDRVSRNVIEKNGYGSHFGHGLGHGLGFFRWRWHLRGNTYVWARAFPAGRTPRSSLSLAGLYADRKWSEPGTNGYCNPRYADP